MITQKIQSLILTRRARGVFSSQTYNDDILVEADKYFKPPFESLLQNNLITVDSTAAWDVFRPQSHPVDRRDLIRFRFMERVFNKVYNIYKPNNTLTSFTPPLSSIFVYDRVLHFRQNRKF